VGVGGQHRAPFRRRDLLLILSRTGLAASAAHILTIKARPPSVGASGALSGVLGAYLVLYPQNRVRVFVLRSASSRSGAAVLGFWFLQQLISGVAALSVDYRQTTGVAVWAHIGGFVAGVELAIPLRLAITTRRHKPPGWSPRVVTLQLRRSSVRHVPIVYVLPAVSA